MVGFLVFFGLNALLAMAIGGFNVMSALMGIVMGGFTFIGTCMMGLCAVNATSLILAIIVPIIAGILAGILARGSAGRGFIAGLASCIVGYYIAFVMFIIYVYATFGGLGMFINMQALPLLLSYVLLIPILAGVLGGIGGALLSALLAQQAPDLVQSGPVVSTTVMQSPYMQQPYQPAYQQPYQPAYQPQPPSSPTKVICPACRNENDLQSTFCQSCGTRMKS